MSTLQRLSVSLMILAVSGCAVVTTTAVVGSAAVGVATTAVSITYDASKAVATGAVAAGGYAYDAATASSAPTATVVIKAPRPTPSYEATTSIPLTE
jgi:hypothetical protein